MTTENYPYSLVSSSAAQLRELQAENQKLKAEIEKLKASIDRLLAEKDVIYMDISSSLKEEINYLQAQRDKAYYDGYVEGFGYGSGQYGSTAS